jgi:hypothetical protein
MVRKLGRQEIHNTRDVINENTKICALVYARAKFGKTTMASTLDAMTKKFFGKPSLYIAVEAGEGGGTMSVREMEVDYVSPNTEEEMSEVLAGLASDKYYGGVILDSSSEYARRILQPYAMRLPSRERQPQRLLGVPDRGDYQTMGEAARKTFNSLVALTVAENYEIRKHLVVTALYKERQDDDGNLVKIHPDLPGAMADTATAMFQTVGTLELKARVQRGEDGKPQRTLERVFVTEADGVKVIGDRTHLFPKEGPADFVELWERYWVPEIKKTQQRQETQGGDVK